MQYLHAHPHPLVASCPCQPTRVPRLIPYFEISNKKDCLSSKRNKSTFNTRILGRSRVYVMKAICTSRKRVILLQSNLIKSNQITSHHITSNRIKSHHITSHHITSHHIISHHITSHHITSHHITSHHITSNEMK